MTENLPKVAEIMKRPEQRFQQKLDKMHEDEIADIKNEFVRQHQISRDFFELINRLEQSFLQKLDNIQKEIAEKRIRSSSN